MGETKYFPRHQTTLRKVATVFYVLGYIFCNDDTGLK